MMNTVEPVKSRYQRLSAERQNFLDRARLCSQVTIPSLIPPESFTGSTLLDTPFQSIGATGVNSLASQLLLALFPPNAPFFRLTLDEFRFGSLEAQSPTIKQEADTELGKVERRVMLELEIARVRSAMDEGVRHLLIGGNGLLFIPKEGEAKHFPLSEYVLDRDTAGSLLEIIIQERVDPQTLPEAVRTAIAKQPEVNSAKPIDALNADAEPRSKTVELYTVVRRNAKKFDVWQEIEGVEITGSRGSYVPEELPYLPLGFRPIKGSPYARSMCEEYLGDLLSAEGLSQAIVEGSLSAARTLYLVRPNAVVRMKDLNEARNCSYVYGNDGDVKALQSEKALDLRVARETLQDVVGRLSVAFMMHSSVRRDAERVTAEEIRYMAQQLEQNLGGVYSLLSQSLQLPLVRIMLGRLRRAKVIGKIDDKVVKPVVIAGIEALGRGNDLNRLDVFIGAALQQLGETVASRINVGEYLRRRATSLGIEAQGLVYTDEELQAQAQQAQQSQLMTDTIPGVAKQMAASQGKSS